jgi:flagellar motor switch protein FliN/FliY
VNKMGDGSLSQEEIDALLQGADDLGTAIETPPVQAPAAAGAPAAAELSDDEKNELRAFAQQVGESMGVTLSTVTAKTVDIKDPQVDVLDAEALKSQLEGKLVQITADYTEGISGKHSFIISEETAKQIAALMMAQEEGDLTDMALSALTEGFSQMSGAALNTIEDKVGSAVKTSTLNSKIIEGAGEIDAPDGSFVKIRYALTTDGRSSFIDEVMDINIAQSLTGGSSGMQGVSAAPPSTQQGLPAEDLFQQVTSQPSAPQPSVGVQSVQFAPLAQGRQSEGTGNIGLLMDVSMQLTVELGRTKMLIKDILGMGEGTIVELDKLAGEPVDLLVNGKLIAKGEVVVIDENFGVRVTDIISPMERISNLE